ncbi:GLPGLI family protein [Parapedobacter luteus]|uniref:GLPGLI family protein n=1 Tax=Parapedobacter luteus TaxID=623280 RepID=A0A1T4ZUP7_9SPHI|nr:GLPGLI family protein [Parapedobacter luteus]SKB26406.1 GLPGLI family protein [Parapedobacter luteus]
MKSKLLIILCLIRLTQDSFSQKTGYHAQHTDTLHFDRQVIYRATYQTDSTDTESRKQLDFELLLNDGLSLFQSIKKFRADSVYYAEKKSKSMTIGLRPVDPFNYQVIKETGTITTYDSPFGMNLNGKEVIYYYEEYQQDLNWDIRPDTMTIANLLCQRADLYFGNRHWIAWFTTDIPIQDGPYKFAGLPGLIISISDVNDFWRFEMTNIRNIDKNVVINFQDWYEFAPATKERLYRERRHYQANIFDVYKTAGALRFENAPDEERALEEARKQIAAQMAKDNNWIELYP